MDFGNSSIDIKVDMFDMQGWRRFAGSASVASVRGILFSLVASWLSLEALRWGISLFSRSDPVRL